MRKDGIEIAKPITVGNNVWIGTGCLLYTSVSDRVTDEADMGLGLFYRLPLEASDEVWAETCARANAVSPPAFSKRKRGIERRGYSVENAVKRAEELYDGKS